MTKLFIEERKFSTKVIIFLVFFFLSTYCSKANYEIFGSLFSLSCVIVASLVV